MFADDILLLGHSSVGEATSLPLPATPPIIQIREKIQHASVQMPVKMGSQPH
ncbi:hypothetical protein LIER_36144 [Lithospermum erythrorhizon]|uniref:Uncharacterized protein n=1 Tax=Lithospermum erythrorhizon TaxID=34254 RepID=A0AAV3P1S9_LITER